jgi:hypothetical protein
MNIADEIEAFSHKDDKPTLRWLFAHYHMRSEWFLLLRIQKRGMDGYHMKSIEYGNLRRKA